MISSKLVNTPISVSNSASTNTLADLKEEYLHFGPVGEATYLSYGPESPNRSDYAVAMIKASFSNTDTYEARGLFWQNFEDLQQHLSTHNSNNKLDIVSDLYAFVTSINSRANEQLGDTPTGLGLHLNEVKEFCCNLFVNIDGNSRIPLLLSDRHAQLIAYVIAPLHDVLKYLGKENAQIVPDHEILLAEISKKYFTDRTAIINGSSSILSQDDVDFIAAVIGDHENIFKEHGRESFISSQDSVQRAKALFSLADTLTGCFKEQGQNTGIWLIDEPALDKRFINLCFRHIDLVEGKTFRPSWIVHATRDLLRALDHLRDSGYKFFDSQTSMNMEKIIIDGSLISIERAIEKDKTRSKDSGIEAEKKLSASQLEAISKSRNDLFSLLTSIYTL